MNRTIFRAIWAFCLSQAIISTAAFGAAVPTGSVVSSIKPVHSLVEAVLGDSGSSLLLIDGSSSMHGYQLKPSQQRALSTAKIVFFIDGNAETFLERAFLASESTGRLVPLADNPNIQLLKKRQGDDWAKHVHNAGHEHAHGHEKTDIHAEHGTDVDLHIWLDPQNALLMVQQIQEALTNAFPDFAATFTANAEQVSKRLMELDLALEKSLHGVQKRPFIVFHDAFSYFEKRYSLSGVGSILLDTSLSPSVSQIRSVREKIDSSKAVCVFSEPQFSDKIISIVKEGKSVKSARVDPLGASIDAGEALYFQLMKELSQEFIQCLEP